MIQAKKKYTYTTEKLVVIFLISRMFPQSKFFFLFFLGFESSIECVGLGILDLYNSSIRI